MTLRGKIKNGAVVLDAPAPLPDGTAVEVRAVVPGTADPAADQSTPSLFDRYKRFIGVAEDLPTDLAAEHDHYIHGTPKRTTP